MATTVTMLLSSLRRLALAKYSVSNFDCFGLAPQQAAPRRLPIPKASAQCPARSSPSCWIRSSFCSDREQRGSAVLGRTKQLLVIWHALAEHQAADIARLIEVDP